MGSMATLHEGCLQVYICSREGQIVKKKKNPSSRFCENASATFSALQVTSNHNSILAVCSRSEYGQHLHLLQVAFLHKQGGASRNLSSSSTHYTQVCEVCAGNKSIKIMSRTAAHHNPALIRTCNSSAAMQSTLAFDKDRSACDHFKLNRKSL